MTSLYLKRCFCDSSNSENCRPLWATRCMPVVTTNGWRVRKPPPLKTEGWRAPQQLHLWSCSPWLLLISGPLQACMLSAHGFIQTLSTDSAKIKHGTQFFIRTRWLQTLAFWKKRKRTTKKLLRLSLGLFSTGCHVSELESPTVVSKLNCNNTKCKWNVK